MKEETRELDEKAKEDLKVAFCKMKVAGQIAKSIEEINSLVFKMNAIQNQLNFLKNDMFRNYTSRYQMFLYLQEEFKDVGKEE